MSATTLAIGSHVNLEQIVAGFWGPPISFRRGNPRWAGHCHGGDGANGGTFEVDRSRNVWTCFVCQDPKTGKFLSGDAISFVQMVERCNFVDALDYLNLGRYKRERGQRRGSVRAVFASSHSTRAEPKPAPPEWTSAILALIEQAEAALWSPAGDRMRDYLRWRGFSDQTIRAARLGYRPRSQIEPSLPLVKAKERKQLASGLTIPWFDHDGRPVHLGVRVASHCWSQMADPDAESPPGAKYGSAQGGERAILYPDAAIRAGQDLILVEGELDCLTLRQELAGLDVAIVTLGSASNAIDNLRGDCRLAVLGARRIFVAGDTDVAGQKRAAEQLAAFPKRAVRVIPPRAKDWNRALQNGVNLRELWSAILNPAPIAVSPTHAETPPHLSVDPWGVESFAAVFVEDALTSMGYDDDLVQSAMEFWRERAGMLEFAGDEDEGLGLSRADANREAAKLTHRWAADVAQAEAAGELRRIGALTP